MGTNFHALLILEIGGEWGRSYRLYPVPEIGSNINM